MNINYDIKKIKDIAEKFNYAANTIEKVLRLKDILDIIYQSEIGEYLALKGGTAINFFLLDDPRLSVDIDFDFIYPSNREEMIEKRKIINEFIRLFMSENNLCFIQNQNSFILLILMFFHIKQHPDL